MAAVTHQLEDGIAWIEIDVPEQAVNVASRAVREELQGQLDWVRTEGGVRAAVLTSGKPDSFIAGADIEEFAALRTRDEAMSLVRQGQALVNQLEALGKPVVAAIHGSCLGGGVEAALVCTYRIATDHPKTALGLPEVQLGLIPAAGGCQRLPRLIGVRAALDIILAGKTLKARDAYSRGIVDELVHPAILRDVAKKVARRLIDGWQPKRSRRGAGGLLLDGNALGRKLVFSQAKKAVLKKTGGHYPAPLAALEAVEHGLNYGVEAGLDSEAAHFAELAVGDVAQNLVGIFFATRALKKDPGVQGEVPEPKRIARVAVVGAGFMGSSIAGVAVARTGADVRLRDTTLEQVSRGLLGARSILNHRLKRRRISKYDHGRLASLLSGGTDWAGFGNADLVVEAVFEDLEVKQEVLSAVESEVGDDCILASNTSTLPVAEIATALQRPERVVGMHFFSPVERMPLLEVITAEHTSPGATVTAVAFGRAMGKTVIVVRDRPGFWVNRILAPYLNEACRLLKEGVPVDTLDGTMTLFGFPVGPIALLDEIGLDIVVKASAVLHDALGERMRPVDVLGLLTQNGRLGRKSRRGFYRYDGKTKKVDPTALEIVGVTPQDAALPEDDVRRRLIYSMLNEAVHALDEGVVRSARDGDVGAVFGIGFPAFRGGPLRYLDALGAEHAVAVLAELAERYGERFEPASRLKKMAQERLTFYAGS
jgi:3-hydroxyacyl-CoA dehydrogenase/enoyl-CoA hydratase/3-hydroxybutyryl-CoA epimerase